MKTRTNRSAIRGRRGASRKRLVLTPPTKRGALLGGTALASGVLAGLAAFVAMPQPAMADCSAVGNVITCSGATAVFSHTVVGAGNVDADILAGTSWNGVNNSGSSGYFNVNATSNAANNIDLDIFGTTTLTNTGTGLGINLVSGLDGTVDVTIAENVSITSGNDPVRLRNSANTGLGTIIVNSSGAISATGSGQAIDAEAGAGGVTVNLLAGSANSATEAIAAKASGSIANGWGDVNVNVSSGVTVAGTAEGAIFAFTIGADSTGSVFVNNSGAVTGTGVNGNGVDARATLGSVSVENWGHIQSTSQSGVRLTAGGTAFFGNHSYLSVMGTSGAEIGPAGQAIVDNSHGLTAGLTVDGIRITDINGVSEGGEDLTPDDWAVNVFNGSGESDGGGVIAGLQNGLYINNVFGNPSEDATDILVDNSGRYEFNSESETWSLLSGGLIAGVMNDGIFVSEGNGDLVIVNDLTRLGSINLNGLDPLVYETGEGGEGDGLLWGVLPGFPQSGFTTGIYGGWNGVSFGDLGGDAAVFNRHGQIVGASEDGITFGFIAGSVYIDNSGDNAGDILGGMFLPVVGEGGVTLPEGQFLPGGTIWGGTNGINGGFVGEDVGINNSLGSIFGRFGGVYLTETEDVGIVNLGGLVQGYYDDAISVQSSDKLGVVNGAWWNWDTESWEEGVIIGGDSAISSSADKVGVANLPGGLIVGDGDTEDGQAVMEFWTWSGTPGEGGSDGDGAFVFNAGIATSHHNPHVDRPWYWPDVNEVPEFTINSAQIISDVDEIALFAMSGGSMGSVDSLGALGELTINDYARTASDGLIVSEGGALIAVNMPLGGLLGLISEGESGFAFPEEGGVMFGRIIATGQSYDHDLGEGGEVVEIMGNTVFNTGAWFTTNTEDFGIGALGGNILLSEGHDAVYNFGFIQTAFGTEGGDYTSFWLDEFNNGSFGLLEPLGDGGFLLEGEGGGGWLSMVDGTADDDTYIFGNFVGARDPAFRSYLAVDANLASYADNGASDVLWIGSEGEGGDGIFGSTGVVVNDLSPGSENIEVGTAILFATGGFVENSCDAGAWCVDGDAFFMSELNPNYLGIGGIGFIRDGMYMWGVKQNPELLIQQLALCEDECNDFYFVADWGPDSYEQPTLTTAAQGAWYDSGGVVEDHIYGNVYPQGGAGGAGADLIYDAPPVIVPEQKAAHGSILWGRATGNWSNRDTEVVVDDGINTLTFDTGYKQDTYSLLAGLEFRPTGDSDARLGLFGGFVGSQVRYDDYGANARLSGGTVGGYGAVINGPWYLDAEVKGDFLTVKYTSPSVEVSTKATSVGLLANTGYRMEGAGGFFEPIGSLAFVHTSLDDATGGGADITYSNGDSFRAGVGARIGTTMANANGSSTELDLLGKVWNEFGQPNTVTVTDGATTETFTDGISGVFGEVVGRATVYSADRMSSGFISAGAKFGSEWVTISAKAGVRQGF